jgi:hypothetical protein
MTYYELLRLGTLTAVVSSAKLLGADKGRANTRTVLVAPKEAQSFMLEWIKTMLLDGASVTIGTQNGIRVLMATTSVIHVGEVLWSLHFDEDTEGVLLKKFLG